MIKKKGRGGARKGAGRKAVLNLHERLWIGSLCDEFQAKLRERLALAEYEKQPRVKATRKAQEQIRKRRLMSEGDIRLAFKEAYRELKKADLRKGLHSGFVRIPLPRGRTREQICNLISDDLIRRGRLRVTPRQVNDAWKECRAFAIRSRAGGRGDIASDAELLEVEAEVAKWPLKE
jgi:hypothetical protein